MNEWKPDEAEDGKQWLWCEGRRTTSWVSRHADGWHAYVDGQFCNAHADLPSAKAAVTTHGPPMHECGHVAQPDSEKPDALLPCATCADIGSTLALKVPIIELDRFGDVVRKVSARRRVPDLRRPGEFFWAE